MMSLPQNDLRDKVMKIIFLLFFGTAEYKSNHGKCYYILSTVFMCA
jgi:hypothetical protein